MNVIQHPDISLLLSLFYFLLVRFFCFCLSERINGTFIVIGPRRILFHRPRQCFYSKLWEQKSFLNFPNFLVYFFSYKFRFLFSNVYVFFFNLTFSQNTGKLWFWCVFKKKIYCFIIHFLLKSFLGQHFCNVMLLLVRNRRFFYRVIKIFWRRMLKSAK